MPRRLRSLRVPTVKPLQLAASLARQGLGISRALKRACEVLSQSAPGACVRPAHGMGHKALGSMPSRESPRAGGYSRDPARATATPAVRGLAQEALARRPSRGKAQRSKQGLLPSKLQPGIRNCIATASSRAPSPCA